MITALRYMIIGFCILLIIRAVLILVKSIAGMFKGACIGCVYCKSCEKSSKCIKTKE